MSSDDPRHGTNAGYVAGCRDACCLRAKSRYDKARKWELHSTGQHRKVPAYRALRRLRALQALGWSIPQIARRADVNERHLYSLSRHGTLYRSTFVKIVRAYDGMCMSLPPTTTTSERISAVKARKWALRNGYAPPLAWDDIDDPDEQPVGMVRDDTHVDEAVVLRILDGDNRVHANAAERVEVCRRWVAAGRSLKALERLTGWRPDRYYKIEEGAA